jgi:prophage antirepressor-like protein
MSNVSVFNFEALNVRVVIGENGEPLFVAKDVAVALGYARPNDAVNLHCKGTAQHRPLQTAGGMQQVRVIDESDIYRLIFGSELESANKFQDWVVSEVLPSIRKTGGYSTTAQKDKLELDLMFADTIAKTLRLSNSSMLSVLGKIEKQYDLTPMLPAYAVDAPMGDTTGSSKPTKSASALLKENGYDLSAQAFNKIALADNWLEKLTRQSSSGTKEFLSVTAKGLRFGKNVISPSNQREIQPHWYVDSFK